MFLLLFVWDGVSLQHPFLCALYTQNATMAKTTTPPTTPAPMAAPFPVPETKHRVNQSHQTFSGTKSIDPSFYNRCVMVLKCETRCDWWWLLLRQTESIVHTPSLCEGLVTRLSCCPTYLVSLWLTDRCLLCTSVCRHWSRRCTPPPALRSGDVVWGRLSWTLPLRTPSTPRRTKCCSHRTSPQSDCGWKSRWGLSGKCLRRGRGSWFQGLKHWFDLKNTKLMGKSDQCVLMCLL